MRLTVSSPFHVASTRYYITYNRFLLLNNCSLSYFVLLLKNSVSFLIFLFIGQVYVFLCTILLVFRLKYSYSLSLEISIQLLFLPFIFLRFSCFPTLPILLLAALFNIYLFFNAILDSLHCCINAILYAEELLFILLFLTHRIRLCHLSCASSSISKFFRSF